MNPAIEWLEDKYYQIIDLKERLVNWNERNGDIPLLVAALAVLMGVVGGLLILQSV